MATSLLHTPTDAAPQVAQDLAKQAPDFFKSQRSWSLPWPLNLLTAAESQEKWQTYENLLLACLRTGDDKSAYLCLEELTDRFGMENERVLALRGLYKEATAKTQQDLQTVLQQYEDMLKEDPSVFSIRKRRAALLRSMGRIPEAITALTNLVDTSPTDPEVWSELSDAYISQGAFEQAIYCLEEVLLIVPNAWNFHAKVGEVLVLSTSKLEAGEAQLSVLAEAVRRFCRSIELCDNYLRGFYGLKLTTNRLLTALPASSSKTVASGRSPLPSLSTTKKLNELATSKLAEIVRRSAANEKDWDGYNAAEIQAARELLNRNVQKIER